MTENKESFASNVLRQNQHCVAVAVAVMVSQTLLWLLKYQNFPLISLTFLTAYGKNREI